MQLLYLNILETPPATSTIAGPLERPHIQIIKHDQESRFRQVSAQEAFYLLSVGKCKVLGPPDAKKEFSQNELLNLLCPHQRALCMAYRELAGYGWHVRPGLGYAADFLLYGEDPSLVHSAWCVKVVRVGVDVFRWTDAIALNRIAHTAKKRVLVGFWVGEGEKEFWENSAEICKLFESQKAEPPAKSDNDAGGAFAKDSSASGFFVWREIGWWNPASDRHTPKQQSAPMPAQKGIE